MKSPRISEAIGNIPEDLVNDAVTYKKTYKNNTLIKWGSVAACLCLIICATVMVPMLSGGNFGHSPTPDNYNRYKDFTIHTGEYGIVWPWEYKTIYEKYNSVDIEGAKFTGRGREIPASLVGEKIGTYQTNGYDDMLDEEHYKDFDVYEIKDVASDGLVAVKMDGKYYVFISCNQNPPSTLNDVLKEYSLDKHVKLGKFSVVENGKDKSYHFLPDDGYIWSILKDVKNAETANFEGWHENRGNYISFTVTSDALGVYKHVMYITESGYLWTNVFDQEYLYFIGEDAAGRIIKYTKENSTVEKSEPYNNTIAGKIVEITNEYILVDDSILCKDPDDGITYKVKLNDIKIFRYVECNVVGVGSTVVVAYDGTVDENNGNAINNAIGISEGIIAEGDVLIPE